ncbi:hypothetical protein, partial [Burkholderia cenocepacia]
RPIHAGSLKETSGLNRLTHKKSDTPDQLAALAQRQGFNVERQTIELQGLCQACRSVSNA